MREKIAEIYLKPIEDWDTGQYTPEEVAYMCADQILAYQREKIEKVENPYSFVLGVSRYQAGQHKGFEDFRQKILSLFNKGVIDETKD